MGFRADDPFAEDFAWVPGVDHTAEDEILNRLHRFVVKLGADRVLSWGPGDLARFVRDTCGAFHAVGGCNDCHAKTGLRLTCGREWCPTCGEMDSYTHAERAKRWLPKLQQMSSIGYLVIEARTAARQDLEDITELRKAKRRMMRMLKDEGILRGLGRWHWFGDPSCPNCRTATGRPRELVENDGLWTCKRCGYQAKTDDLDMKYNPHMNLLFDGRYIAPKDFAEMREKVRKADPRFYLAHYSFARLVATTGLVGQALANAEKHNHKTIRKFRHLARYVTRATFRSVDWAPDLADSLTESRFHTTWTWGGAERWQGPLKWGSEEQEEQGGCPICHGHIHWQGVDTADHILALYGTLGEDKGPYILEMPGVVITDGS